MCYAYTRDKPLSFPGDMHEVEAHQYLQNDPTAYVIGVGVCTLCTRRNACPR